MSLYQCDHCGCMENTGTGPYWDIVNEPETLNWKSGKCAEGQMVCSSCGPSEYVSGRPTGYGSWHGAFERIFLEMGMYKTDDMGNLVHKVLGAVDIRDHRMKNS